MIRTESADVAAGSAPEWTVADLAERFGSLPASRIRTDVPPGTATEDDLERVGALCELIDGVLVEKAVSDDSSIVGGILLRLLGNFVAERRLGWVHASDGFFWLASNLRAPDVSFTRKEQRPGGLLRKGHSDVAPVLVAEVLSPGNTADEMARKRREFFARGTQLFWIVDPLARTIDVYTRPEKPDAVLRDDDTLTGAPVLPDFTLSVRELFDAAELSDEPPA
ncbi:MAG: Uma2 family endonuclease [Planctomycetaceae bacterium]|nr:Uma2 family endonuclease [Planctomycetaceae bacterium]